MLKVKQGNLKLEIRPIITVKRPFSKARM